MKKACIYTRVSTEKQDIEGYSLEEQEARCKGAITAQGWEYVGTFSDPGISGKTMERPGLKKMLHSIDAGEIDAVVVLKLDRLSRSQKDTLTIIEDTFIAKNITFVSVTETLDTSTPWGRAMIGILASFGQLERENIVQRTTMGRNAKAAQGGYAGGRPPLGYKATPEGLAVVEAEAEIVRLIFELKKQGYSQVRTAKELCDRGYTRRDGRPFSHSTVEVVLNNKDMYLGNWKYGEVYIENHHEAIL
jgi:site-specific DNA recombinase